MFTSEQSIVSLHRVTNEGPGVGQRDPGARARARLTKGEEAKLSPQQVDDFASSALRALEQIDGISTERQKQLEAICRSEQQSAEFRVHSSPESASASAKVMTPARAQAPS